MALNSTTVINSAVTNIMSTMTGIEDDTNIRTIVTAIVSGIFDALQNDAVVTGTTATANGPQPLTEGKIT